jgi:putative ABC transport system ATP-binding protein
VLVLKNIGVTFDGGTSIGSTILNGINLRVCGGEFVIIIGGNGAGKTTLFNVISGLLRPTTGQVMLDGKDMAKIPAHERSQYVARVVQNTMAGTMCNLTIFENLAFAFTRGKRRKLLPYSTSARRKIFAEKLESLGIGLEKRMNATVASLSGGQRQAIGLLMSVLAPSKILLLDEITAALDPKISDSVMALANKIIVAEGRTTLMITHNMAHATAYGDRMLLLANSHFQREFSGPEKEALTPSELAKVFGEV